MAAYDPAKYTKGARVKIAPRADLEAFQRTWKYHHKLEDEQLAYADAVGTIKDSGIYHGGDVLYWFEDIPGTWHECCLVSDETKFERTMRHAEEAFERFKNAYTELAKK